MRSGSATCCSRVPVVERDDATRWQYRSSRILYALSARQRRVPSKAQFIQLSLHPAMPPSAAITSPASRTSRYWPGASVNFSTTSTAFSVLVGLSRRVAGDLDSAGVRVTSFSVRPELISASLTAIDSFGNTSILARRRGRSGLSQQLPDFSIASACRDARYLPANRELLRSRFSPLRAFDSPITLSVRSQAGFPTGISSSGFSPSQINGNGT